MVALKYSVIIPTYNRASFLPSALESVFAQSVLPSEVLVIDDGSTDNTKELLKNFPNITYIFQNNSGVSSARNIGIEHASYEWIAFLDSDDVWHKDKMLKQLSWHEEHQNSLVSYTDEVWIRHNKQVKIPKKFQKNIPTTFTSEIEFCNIAPSSVVIHTSVFESVGVFDETLEVCEDYDLWLRILESFSMKVIKEALISKVAGHDDQLSYKHWGMDRFRVHSLEKLYGLSKYSDIIHSTLLSKYELLLQGAIKYRKDSDITLYEKKIEHLKVMGKQ